MLTVLWQGKPPRTMDPSPRGVIEAGSSVGRWVGAPDMGPYVYKKALYGCRCPGFA